MKVWFTIVLITFVAIILYRDIFHSKSPELTRVDINQLEKKEVMMLLDEKLLDEVKTTWDEAEWTQIKVEMNRMEDVDLRLFYDYGPDIPEEVDHYKVWFSSNESLEIVNDVNLMYSKIEGKKATRLKYLIISDQVDKVLAP